MLKVEYVRRTAYQTIDKTEYIQKLREKNAAPEYAIEMLAHCNYAVWQSDIPGLVVVTNSISIVEATPPEFEKGEREPVVPSGPFDTY